MNQSHNSKTKVQNWAQTLFWIALIFHMVFIWWNNYFLTSDGPSHLYNASVLKDMIIGNGELFKPYFQINLQTEPNWTGHIFLALLMFLVKAETANKILISIYILLFAFQAKRFFKNQGASFLLFIFLPFIFQSPFSMGFFNFLLSISLFLLTLNFWMNNSSALTWRHSISLMFLFLLIYFTHPVGLILIVLCIGFLTVSELAHQPSWKPYGYKWLKIFVASIPTAVLSLDYLIRKGTETSPLKIDAKKLFHDLIELRVLVNYDRAEVNVALALGVFIGIILLYAVYSKLKHSNFNFRDVFFVLVIVSLVVYFFQPNSIGGAGVTKDRLAAFPFIFLILWFSQVRFPNWLKWTVMTLGFCFTLILLALRFPSTIRASKALESHMTALEHIQEGSTLLFLSFDKNGRTPEGEFVANRAWLFSHSGDHLGIEKKLIMLPNYEANTGYFPLIWNDSLNPFIHLAGLNGIEHESPDIDIWRYERTGAQIDYVLTWCESSISSDNHHKKSFRAQMDGLYYQSFVSDDQRILLYKHKD